MTDIRDRLRDADPLLTDPGLSRDDVARMRRAVLDAAQAPPRETGLHWKKTLPIAAAVALMAGAGIDTARRVSRQTPLPAAAAAPDATAVTKTQVHFSTPGGTRIIWTIDPAFTLTENR
jgi:hypothetical protein